MIQMWNQQRQLSDGSLHIGVAPLERALVAQGTVLSERTFARYRAASATVFEREWRQTRDALAVHRRAAIRSIAARGLRCAIAKDTCGGSTAKRGSRRSRRRRRSRELTAAVALFREAAELRADWPDPFLGLMRTFIALDDVERGADALAQAAALWLRRRKPRIGSCSARATWRGQRSSRKARSSNH